MYNSVLCAILKHDDIYMLTLYIEFLHDTLLILEMKALQFVTIPCFSPFDWFSLLVHAVVAISFQFVRHVSALDQWGSRAHTGRVSIYVNVPFPKLPIR
jgi:hypothetical protein